MRKGLVISGFAVWYLGVGLALVTRPASADTLKRPEFVNADRAFLLPSCPRAAALHSDYLNIVDQTARTSHGGGGTESIASVAVAFAPAVVDGALNALQGWLDERAKDRQVSAIYLANGFAAAPAMQGVQGPATSQCLVLVSGTFGASSGPGAQPPTDPVGYGDWSEKWLAWMGLTAPPGFYAEIALIYSANFSAFRAVPAYVEYRDSKLNVSRNPRHSLAIALLASRNGVALGATVLPIARDVRLGVQLTPGLLSGQSGPWLPVDPVRRPPENEPEWLLQAPFSVQATLVESTEPNGLDRLLADLFTSTKPDLAQAAKGVINATQEKTTAPKND